MTNRTIRRVCAVAIGVATVGLLGPVWLKAGAATPATTGALLSAVPQSDLADGQFVKLTFTGFEPTIGLAFRECIPSPVTVATDCTPQNTQVGGVTDATGTGSVYLPIHAGKLANAGATGTIPCDVAHPCVVAAMRTLTDLTTSVFAPLTFARSKDDCPAPPADFPLGGGSSAAYRAIYYWESAACIPPANLAVGYTVSNSHDGIANFLNGLTDFAATGPFATLPTPITPTPLTYKFAPVATSALVLAYRMYDNSGPQIVSLTLTPDLIAQIFLGKIPNWAANAAIKALNPGVQFPTRIIPFVRGEHCSQTLVFTSWLAANAPTTWTAPPSEIFPIAPSGVQGVTGSSALGLAVADPLTDWLGQGNIGFMDSSTAAFYGMPTVNIKRADGTLMSATPSAITQAIADATTNTDGTLALKYADPNTAAYSMAMPEYMMVPTNTITQARGTTLAAFLRYAVQNQAQLPQGYSPLPPTLAASSLKVADAIPALPPPKPSPSPSPTPAPTPTPTPVPTPTPPPLSNDSGFTGAQIPLSVLPPVQAIAPQSIPIATPTATPRPPATGGSAAAKAATPAKPAALNFAQLGDSSWGRYLLLSVVVLGLVGLGVGVAVEVVARRRHFLSTMASDEAGG